MIDVLGLLFYIAVCLAYICAVLMVVAVVLK